MPKNSKCSTCRKAAAWLRERGIAFDERAIRETPPSEHELRRVLAAYGGNLRRLLSENGNLVRRAFLVAGTTGSAGFREEGWARLS